MCKKTGFAVRLVSYSASDEHRLLVRLHVVNVKMEIVLNQVSSLHDILKHLRGSSAENNTRVPMLLAHGGISANTEQCSNTSRSALSQALNAETATVAASEGKRGAATSITELKLKRTKIT